VNYKAAEYRNNYTERRSIIVVFHIALIQYFHKQEDKKVLKGK